MINNRQIKSYMSIAMHKLLCKHKNAFKTKDETNLCLNNLNIYFFIVAILKFYLLMNYLQPILFFNLFLSSNAGANLSKRRYNSLFYNLTLSRQSFS